VKYLLDVNALVALAALSHQFHPRVVGWLRSESSPVLLTCSITELGFVRVLSQASAYGYTVREAQALLLELKRNTIVPFQFILDGNDISLLPRWVKAPKQTTDGHLVQLAVTHGAVLATLDGGISRAYLIP
jgi:uncharacterized protein